MPTTTETGLREYLAALFEGAPGLVEIRPLPSTARAFFAPTDYTGMRAFLERHARDVPSDELFVGVAARRDDTSGTAENCATLRALFADLDFKMLPEAQARDRLARFRFAPSLVIFSGHGLHAYWLLQEALDLTTPAARASAKQLLVRLAAALGADPSAAEVARVLRPPGTLNRKPLRPARSQRGVSHIRSRS
jgi:hypothetical protein